MIKNSLGKVGDQGDEIVKIGTAVAGVSDTLILSLDLPIGSWMVSAGIMCGGGGSNTYWGVKLNILGVDGNYYGDSITQAIVNSAYGNQVVFPTRRVDVLSSTSDKTFKIIGNSSAGNGTGYASIRAIRIKPTA